MKREERVRLSNLAREWNVESKVLVELCKQLGIASANQLTLEPSEVARLREALRASRAQPAAPKSAGPPTAPAVPAPPVPTALVAPVPAPVWDRHKRARPAVAPANPATVPPVAASAPPPTVAAGAAPPTAPAAPLAPPSARPSGARNLNVGRATPRAPAPLAQQKPTPPSPPVVPATAAPHSGPAAAPVPVAPARNPGIDQLLAIGTRVGLAELDLVPRLAEIDTTSAVFKIQQITERVCRKILGARGARKLDALIPELEQRNLLGKKAVSYLRHIQNLGNHAAQNTDDPLGEEFTLLDVNNTAATLASVLEAAISAKRLEAR